MVDYDSDVGFIMFSSLIRNILSVWNLFSSILSMDLETFCFENCIRSLVNTYMTDMSNKFIFRDKNRTNSNNNDYSDCMIFFISTLHIVCVIHLTKSQFLQVLWSREQVNCRSRKWKWNERANNNICERLSEQPLSDNLDNLFPFIDRFCCLSIVCSVLVFG